MKTSVKLLVIAVLLVWVNYANAQPTVTNFSDLNDVYSLHYHNDTMWIGTTGGVVFRIYPSFTPEQIITFDNGLGSNFITAITVDNNGTKFFGTFDNGITTYNSGVTTLFNQANSNLNNRILCLAADNSGNVWAGTGNGAYRFNGSTWEQFNTSSTVSGEIRSIAVDGSNIWFGTFGNGLYHFDGSTWFHETTADGNILSDQITTLAARNDSLIVGSNLGVSFYNPNGGTWMNENIGNYEIYDAVFLNFSRYISTSNGLYFSTGSVWEPDGNLPGVKTGVIEKQQNNLWIGYNKSGGGTLSYSFVTPGPPYLVTGLQYPGKNSISDITSHNNYVYVATYGNGISRYNGSFWEIFNSSNSSINNYTNSLAMQADTLWIGTDDGAYSYNGESWMLHTTITPVVNAVAVSRLNSDTVWCGTSNGVTRFVNWIQTDFSGTDLYNNEVIGIAVDFNGDVWFLHRNGLTRYHNNSFDLQLSLSDLQVTGAELSDIAADLNSGIWITSNQGVIHYNNGTITRYTNTDGLSDNIVLSVAVDDQNNKYFGTNSSGISMHSQVGWQKITRQNRIPTERITSLHFQPTGSYIWSGGDWGGVSQIHFEPLSVTANSSMLVACFRNPITLSTTVSGGFGPLAYNYSWTSANTGFSSTNASETISPEINDLYYLDVNDGFFARSSNIQVNVNTVDTSDIMGPTTICPHIIYATYSVIPNPDKSYSWSISGGQIISDPYLNKIDVQWDVSQTNGTLYLNESDNTLECAIDHDPVFIEFDNSPAPKIIRKGENMIICTDSGLVSYQWHFNGLLLPNENKQFYFYDSDQGLPIGVYAVEIQNSGYCKLFSEPINVPGSNLKVYPLPVNDILNIDFSSDKLTTGKAEIYNLSGNKTDEITFDKEQVFKHLELNLSNYKPGIYSYIIYLGSERITSGKFIIN